jgi:hypothetical protein
VGSASTNLLQEKILPIKNGMKVPPSSFLGYDLLGIDLFLDDKLVNYECRNMERVEYSIAANQNKPECFAVIECLGIYGTEVVFLSKDRELAQKQLDRRNSLLKALRIDNV